MYLWDQTHMNILVSLQIFVVYTGVHYFCHVLHVISSLNEGYFLKATGAFILVLVQKHGEERAFPAHASHASGHAPSWMPIRILLSLSNWFEIQENLGVAIYWMMGFIIILNEKHNLSLAGSLLALVLKSKILPNSRFYISLWNQIRHRLVSQTVTSSNLSL